MIGSFLDHSREHPRLYDALLGVLACLGVIGIWLGMQLGGVGTLLALCAAVCEGALVYGIWIEPKLLRVTTYEERLVPNSTTRFRLIFVSDVHAGGFRRSSWYERIGREVQALHPDVLVLGGDYVADRASSIAELSCFSQIQAVLGRYFILGNHDFLEDPEPIRHALTMMGYEDLRNRSVFLEREGKKLELQGLDDHWYGNPGEVRRTSLSIPHVTISHSPDVLLDLAEGATDLVLCGHTHAGQIRFPFIGSVLPIPTRLGRKLYAGRQMMNGIRCIVSHGLAESQIRMRIGTRPEIVVVELWV